MTILMHSDEEVFWQIALTLVPGIGCVLAKALAEHFASARDIFRATEDELVRVEKMHPGAAKRIKQFDQFRQADQTLAFTIKHGVRVIFLTDPGYPSRLRQCTDPPTILYYKGNAPLNHRHILSIIGTRLPSDYGKHLTIQLVKDLSAYDVLVVSGLADGIDALAHRCALGNGLPTVGVLGHGLDMIYPPDNRLLAKEMLSQGGLLTEFREGTPAAKFNFPRRNRIVAGISEATVILETGVKGGSIVTASLASGYNREIFAFPGRTTDTKSSGCHALIRQNKAALVTGAADIAYHLNWAAPERGYDKGRRAAGKAMENGGGPAPDSTAPGSPGNGYEEGSREGVIHSLLSAHVPGVHLDELIVKTGFDSSSLAVILLTMELEQVIESLPGMRYRLRP
jgi:DNA processing protein